MKPQINLRQSLSLIVAAGLVLAIGLHASSAQAYSITTASKYSKKLKRYSKSTVIYHLNPAGSDNMPVKTSLDVLRKGFQVWSDIGCSDLSFAEGYHCNLALKSCLYDKGTSCSSDADCPASKNLKLMTVGYKNNGRNELIFAEGNNWTFSQYVLGVTVALNNYTGNIVESDIAFNGKSQKWTTDPNKFGGGWSHLPSVAIHEQGHFFGAMHNLGGWSPNEPPTMTPNVHPYGISATLASDDKKIICFLNPKGGKYSCKSNADCPYVVQRSQSGKEYYASKYVCKGGTCVWGQVAGQGTKKLGDSCTLQADCAKPMYCQPVGGQDFCSQQCNPQTKNCPSGFTCYGYQGQPTKGACIKTPGGGNKKDDGASCTQSQECKSLLCLQGSCEKPCSPGNLAAGCPTGSNCEQISGGGGVCVKIDGPKKTAEGKSCQAPDECKSGVCMKNSLQATEGFCRNTCTGPGSCGKGYKCVSQGEGYQGCLPGKESIASGGVCKFADQCAGGKCILAGDAGKICSQSCTVGDATSCPCGLTCENTGNAALCYPTKAKGCLTGGKSCTGGDECASTVCAKGVCQETCNIITGRDSCGAGKGCIRSAAGKVEGYCAPKGNVGMGKFCLGDELCVTLFCDKDVTRNNETRCSLPCDPKAKTCAVGQLCNPLGEGYGACYIDKNAAGSDASGSDASANNVSGGEVSGAGGSSSLAANDGVDSSGCSARAGSGRAGTGSGSTLPLLLLGLAMAAVVCRRRRATRA